MPTPHVPHGSTLRLAPQVKLSLLPFGGAVLIRTSTLSIVECGEQEAMIIGRLLTHGPPGPDAGPRGEAVRRMSAELVANAWLEPVDSHPAESDGHAPYDDTINIPADTAAPETHRR